MIIADKKPTLRAIDTIFPYPNNAKKHGDDQVAKVAASISKFGWRGNPILVDKTGVIIAGHGRRLAALKLGLKFVPVIVEDDMTADEARAFRLADNRVATGDIDHDLLQAELMDLDFDLVGIFDKKELDFAIADLMTVNDSVFVTDLDSVMDDAQSTTECKIDASGSKRVTLQKALGFKDVSGADVIYLTRFIAMLESKFSVAPDQALVLFAKSFVGEISHE